MNKIITIATIAIIILALFYVIKLNQSPTTGPFKQQAESQWSYVRKLDNLGITTSFAKTENTTKVQIDKNGNKLTFIQAADNPTVQENKDQIIFKGLKDETQVSYKLLNNGLKEEILLNKAPQNNLFPVQMETSGLIVGMNIDNLPIFYDKNGQYQFHLQKPWAKDSKGDVTYALQYHVKKTKEGFDLNLEVDNNWLTDSKRAYPVTIDPTVVDDIKTAGPEDFSKRTATSKTFNMGDGRLATTSSGAPIFYQDSAKKWQDIDESIANSSDDPSYDYQNSTNIYKSSFKKEAKGASIAKFEINGKTINFGLEDNSALGVVNNSSAVVAENTITYPDVYSGVDLRYTVSATQLLEEFVVAAPATASKINSISERFTVSGVTYQEQPDGSIKFMDSQTGRHLWTIPKPVMYELNNQSEQSFGLHYTVTKQGNEYYINKVLDQEGKGWLSDSARDYPVVIDASVGPNSPGTMATDNESGGTASWGTPDNAKVENGITTSLILGESEGFCLASDTLISTENGNVVIQDLKPGNLVYSYNSASRAVELKKVGNVFTRPISNYDNKYYIIHVGGRFVKATYNHFFYANGDWVMAKDLKVGDEVLDLFNRPQIITNIIVEDNYSDYVWDLSIDDNQNFFANGILVHNAGIYDHRVRLIRGGTVGTTDKASGTAWAGALAYSTYGTSSDPWNDGWTWTAEDINASNFGVAISAYGSGYSTNNTSYYLKATNFGFSIPTGSSINGIIVEIKKSASTGVGPGVTYYIANIDHICITVYYTEAAPVTPAMNFNGVNLQGIDVH